jgi:hypothetical protein
LKYPSHALSVSVGFLRHVSCEIPSKDNMTTIVISAEFERLTGKKRRSAMCNSERGKIGWILLWLLGIPIPILVVLFLLRGCT